MLNLVSHTERPDGMADLERKLRARIGVPAGLTRGDFQHALDLLGVKLSDPLSSIEYGVSVNGTGRIVRDDDASNDRGGVEIREA